MKKIILLLILLTVSFGYSQQELIEDFENSPVLDSWDGAAVSVGNDPVGSNLQNMQIDVTAGVGEFWQGAKVTFPADVAMDLTTDLTVNVDVYATTAMTIMGKVEGAGPASADDEAHGGTGWETITFTFNTGADGTATANGEYNVFAVFPNRDGAGGWTNPWASSTTYYDNITAVLAIVEPDPVPTVAAPTPIARNEWDVISLFSNAYNDITITEWSAPWDTADIEDILVDGNDTKKITYGDFLGVDFEANSFDASDMERFHMDYYVGEALDGGEVVLPKWSNHTGGAGETNAHIYTEIVTVSEDWVSLDLALSDFTPQGDGTAMDNFAQFILGTGATINLLYIDNLYLYRAPTAGTDNIEIANVNVYPNPTVNTWNINADQTIKRIEIYDISGKMVLSHTPNNINVELDASSLNFGVYIAKIETSNGINQVKLIKK